MDVIESELFGTILQRKMVEMPIERCRKIFLSGRKYYSQWSRPKDFQLIKSLAEKIYIYIPYNKILLIMKINQYEFSLVYY